MTSTDGGTSDGPSPSEPPPPVPETVPPPRPDDSRPDVRPSDGPRTANASAPNATATVRTDRPNRRRGRVELTRETARWRVARNLIVLLGGTVAALAGLLATSKWTELAAADISGAFDTVITALVTLVGSAVGFYFGTENGPNSGGTNGDD